MIATRARLGNLRRAMLCAALVSSVGCGVSGAGGGGGGDHGGGGPPPIPAPPPKDPGAFTAAPAPRLASGIPGVRLVRIPQNNLRQYEHLTIATLAGLIARGSPELVWVTPNDSAPWVDHLVETRQVETVDVGSTLEMLEYFRGRIPGYVRVDSLGHPDSINAGVSVAGLDGAIVVDQRLELHVASLALPMIEDVTGFDEARVLSERGAQLDPSIVFEQREDILTLLKDLPVLTGGFVFHDGEPRTPFELDVLAQARPGAYLLGWRGQTSEQQMVEDASLNSMALIACDTCQNLATLAQFPYEPPPQPPAPPAPPLEAGVHYVSLLVTDGDNVGFLSNEFWKVKYYGNGLRGSFPMTWELSPSLAWAAPPILEWYRAQATANDSFVAGSSGKGYILPHLEPNLDRFLDETEPLLDRAGLHIATVIDDVPMSSGAFDAYLRRGSIDAVIAKIGNYYQGGNGAVRWVGDKPIVSIRGSIWEGNLTPEQAAEGINSLPRTPGAGVDAVSVVAIHPFSRFGALERDYALMNVAKQFHDGLAPHVRLVPIEEAIQHLKELR